MNNLETNPNIESENTGQTEIDDILKEAENKEPFSDKNDDEKAEIMDELRVEKERADDQERFNELSDTTPEKISEDGKDVIINDEGGVIIVEKDSGSDQE